MINTSRTWYHRDAVCDRMPHHPANCPRNRPRSRPWSWCGAGGQAERVDTRSQDGQRGGQHRDRRECGQRHRRDRAVGHRLEALRHDPADRRAGDDDRRRERDGLTRGHHGSADRGLRRIAFGEFLAEPADDEQAVVDGDARPISVTTDRANTFSSVIGARIFMMPSEPAMVRTADETSSTAATAHHRTRRTA